MSGAAQRKQRAAEDESEATASAEMNAGAFASAVSEAAGIIPGKEPLIPILGNVLVIADAEAGRVTVCGTNLDALIRVPVKADIAASFRSTMPGKHLAKALAALPKDALLRLAPDPSGSFAIVTCGRSRMKLPVLPHADFPDWPAREAMAAFDWPVSEMAAAFGAVAHAMSVEESRFYLMGVLIELRDDALWLAATNSHKLAAIACPAPEGAAGLSGAEAVIVPSAMVMRLAGLSGKGSARIEISDGRIAIATPDGREILSKLVQGSYPDWRRVVPGDDAGEIAAMDLADLDEAVGRAVAAMDAKTQGLRIEIEPSLLRVRALSEAYGDYEEEIPCDWPGEPIAIGINAKYLRETLAQLPVGTLRLRVQGARDVMRFHAGTDEQDAVRRTVVMPMNA